MIHVEKALKMMQKTNKLSRYVDVLNLKDLNGVPPVVHFAIQSDPVGKVGVNGCQASDMLEYVACLFKSLDEEISCGYNTQTIALLDKAILLQHLRTKDRERRKVEGTMEE